MNRNTLMQRLIDAGYPEDQMFHHYSDLYVFENELTKRVISSWCNENGWRRDWFCPTFKDNETGKKMFDCAFAYDPFWLDCLVGEEG